MCTYPMHRRNVAVLLICNILVSALGVFSLVQKVHFFAKNFSEDVASPREVVVREYLCNQL